MRWIILTLIALAVPARLGAGEPPLVEEYLHSGELARGEQVLEAALAASGKDDQIRQAPKKSKLAIMHCVRNSLRCNGMRRQFQDGQYSQLQIKTGVAITYVATISCADARNGGQDGQK